MPKALNTINVTVRQKGNIESLFVRMESGGGGRGDPIPPSIRPFVCHVDQENKTVLKNYLTKKQYYHQTVYRI